MSAERWLPVVDWEGYYEVSDACHIRSVERRVPHGRHGTILVRARIIKQQFHENYWVVYLSRHGELHTRRVHVLALEAFIGRRPEGMKGCHNDGDSFTNNRLTNLRWDTQSNNMFDSVRHGTHPQARKTHCSRGHEYTADNTYLRSSGDGYKGRRCKTCTLERERAQRLPLQSAPTHCPHGHEYTPENTHQNPSTGGRQCRECNRIRNRKRYAERKAVSA